MSSPQAGQRAYRRRLIGRVRSDKMEKTVVVEVVRFKRDSVYKKYVRVRKRYKAHDEQNEFEVGDRVAIGGFLGCLSEKDCSEVAEFLRDTSTSVAPLLGPEGARLLGALSIRQERERIELYLELTGADVAALGALFGDER